MIIPKKIQLAGREIDILFDDNENFAEGTFGRAKINRSEIVLMSENLGVKRDVIEQILIHERMHHINFILGFQNEDREEYVTPASELLYQAITQLYGKNLKIKKKCDTI
jgi:hypothetical protein